MATFITTSYFGIGELKLATNSLASPELTSFIERLESEYLKKLFGFDLYKAFTDALDAGGSIATKWTNLRDGTEYQVTDVNGNSVYVEWPGLINATTYRSLLAYFIFYEWMRIKASENTISGEKQLLDENSNPVSAKQIDHRLTYAYNKGIEMWGRDITKMNSINANHQVYRHVHPSEGITKPLTYIDYYEEILKPTAFNFIYWANDADATTYPNWVFTELSTINSFGI